MGWLNEEMTVDFVAICNKWGLTAPESWRLFEHIREHDGVIREYDIRLFFGIGQEKAVSLIDSLIKARFAIEDATPAPDGRMYEDELTDEEIETIAAIELKLKKPLWR